MVVGILLMAVGFGVWLADGPPRIVGDAVADGGDALPPSAFEETAEEGDTSEGEDNPSTQDLDDSTSTDPGDTPDAEGSPDTEDSTDMEDSTDTDLPPVIDPPPTAKVSPAPEPEAGPADAAEEEQIPEEQPKIVTPPQDPVIPSVDPPSPPIAPVKPAIVDEADEEHRDADPEKQSVSIPSESEREEEPVESRPFEDYRYPSSRQTNNGAVASVNEDVQKPKEKSASRTATIFVLGMVVLASISVVGVGILRYMRKRREKISRWEALDVEMTERMYD